MTQAKLSRWICWKEETSSGYSGVNWLERAQELTEEYKLTRDPKDLDIADPSEWECDEPKICGDCCHFCRCMDDLYQDRGVCGKVPGIKEHDDEMPCYAPELYERCHW